MEELNDGTEKKAGNIPPPQQTEIPFSIATEEANNDQRTDYWTFFKTFFKIGAFTLGGGYAMIPIIESEVVDKRRWIGKDEFLDLIAIAQSCPGVFAINISVFIGYKLRKLKGAFCTALGTALPSFLIILLIAMFFHQFMEYAWVESMFRGIRPAVVALIAVPTFNLAKSAHISLVNCWIPIGSALLIWALGVNPIYIIIAAGVGGYLYGAFLKPTE
ncbi:chromate transporter [Prevotella sp. KH2C16]|uniref:chromate transporter n=1 Tax=Prevotella sp. KH2C16 TaxID=1855325 RepID=UPI0008E0F2F9|nr:chromate transporter [Prevotella sp. KH2C16]SFG65671.1 chromate transporter [Prevotella sp. KH2C16]